MADNSRTFTSMAQFLEECRRAMRYWHLSYHTEKSYLDWICFFLPWIGLVAYLDTVRVAPRKARSLGFATLAGLVTFFVVTIALSLTVKRFMTPTEQEMLAKAEAEAEKQTRDDELQNKLSLLRESRIRAKFPSGISGYSTVETFSAEQGGVKSYDYKLIIKDAKSKKAVREVLTKNRGDFISPLSPGRYIIEVIPGENNKNYGIWPEDWMLRSEEDLERQREVLLRDGVWQVTVRKGHYTKLNVHFQLP